MDTTAIILFLLFVVTSTPIISNPPTVSGTGRTDPRVCGLDFRVRIAHLKYYTGLILRKQVLFCGFWKFFSRK
jgi:hypothetical protein